ncbi:MAG: S41 family peptidase, partial [Spirochaetaceae bacterium]
MKQGIQISGKKEEKRSYGKLAAIFAGAGLLLALAIGFVPQLLADSRLSPEEVRLLQQFETVYRFVRDSYVDEVDPAVLFEGALKGMFESLEDPHSAYLSQDDVRALTDTTAGEFGGVGLYISKEPEDGEKPRFIEVVAPIEGTPAFKAGVHAGDRIIAIEDDSTAPLSIDDVVNRLRGKPGTDVTITIKRGKTVEFDVDITRAIIQVPTAKHAMINENMAYLRIVQFTPHTEEKVREAISFFEQQGYQQMIIDLRGNPGGLLQAVVEVSSLFLDGGLVVGTCGRVASETQEFGADKGVLVPESIELLVLIDKGSASAAEIMAGALKDRGRAILAGETSYGKGSVQQVRTLANGGFRLTMSRYYTPSGEYIDKIGIDPAIEILPPQLTEDEQEYAVQLFSEGRIRNWVRSQSSIDQSGIEA